MYKSTIIYIVHRYFDAFQIVAGNSLQNVILTIKIYSNSKKWRKNYIIIMKSHLTPLIVSWVWHVWYDMSEMTCLAYNQFDVK